MSKETPVDDPRQKMDGGSLKQTDKTWKGPLEKEQNRAITRRISKSGKTPTRINGRQ